MVMKFWCRFWLRAHSCCCCCCSIKRALHKGATYSLFLLKYALVHFILWTLYDFDHTHTHTNFDLALGQRVSQRYMQLVVTQYFCWSLMLLASCRWYWSFEVFFVWMLWWGEIFAWEVLLKVNWLVFTKTLFTNKIS